MRRENWLPALLVAPSRRSNPGWVSFTGEIRGREGEELAFAALQQKDTGGALPRGRLWPHGCLGRSGHWNAGRRSPRGGRLRCRVVKSQELGGGAREKYAFVRFVCRCAERGGAVRAHRHAHTHTSFAVCQRVNAARVNFHRQRGGIRHCGVRVSVAEVVVAKWPLCAQEGGTAGIVIPV